MRVIEPLLCPVRRVEEEGGRYVREVAGPRVRDTVQVCGEGKGVSRE